MYEEQREYRVGINWKDVILKAILLILFVVVLIWLIPNPDLDPLYSRIFNDNIQTMKDAAKSYYTIDRLPENVGESSKMTLEEMENNNMIIPFTDKNGNVCNKSESYIQITKTGEEEYVLKVQLSCGDETDFILETIGCYDVCIGDDCEEELEYQFKKEVASTKTSYVCPSGYTLSGSKCTKTIELNRVSATAKYSEAQTTVINAKAVSSSEDVVYTDPIRTSTTTDYTCPAGYVANGDRCYIYTSGIVVEGTTNSYCPSGYTKYGTTCYKVATPTASTSTCPAGYSENAQGECYKRTNPTTTETTQTCPTGYSSNGTNCVKVTDATATLGSWTFQRTLDTTTPMTSTSSTQYDLVRIDRRRTCSDCYTYENHYIYDVSTRSTTYTCTTGERSGSKCYTYASYNVTAGGTTCSVGTYENGYCYQYTDKVTLGGGTSICPTEYTYSNGKCYLYANMITENGDDETICPSGYVLDAYGRCVDSISGTANSNYTYTCPSGYKTAGTGASTTCYKITGGDVTYTCDGYEGYTLSGATCVKKTSSTIIGYTCNSGYTLTDTKYCVQSKTETINATVKTSASSYYTYKWSTESTMEGWIATGQTRELTE